MTYVPNEMIYNRINEICLKAYDEQSSDPFKMLHDIWDIPDFPMHCPEHHVLIPAVLITAYRTFQGDSRKVLENDLKIADERGRNLLPGFCGYYGACGAGIGAGIFFSLLTDTTPLSVKTWGLANDITSRCLGHIAASGGPRCCKRVSFTTIETSKIFMKERFNIDLGPAITVSCQYHENNQECLSAACPYYPGEE